MKRYEAYVDVEDASPEGAHPAATLRPQLPVGLMHFVGSFLLGAGLLVLGSNLLARWPHSGTPEGVAWTRLRRFLRLGVRMSAAFLLIGAAGAKAYQLGYEGLPASEGSAALFGRVLLVEVEAAVGIWLLLGIGSSSWGGS